LGHGADPATGRGGGEVWFDGELIRKNGMFVPKDLKGLNPANLK
jgi:aminopeptidase